jgi:hypothetical protein
MYQIIGRDGTVSEPLDINVITALGLINIVEIVLGLSTGRRIGDNIAKTIVVRA